MHTQTPTTLTSNEDTERTIERVFADYTRFEKRLLEEQPSWVWESAKSSKYNIHDQSHIQHIRNGVDMLLQLFRSLDGNYNTFSTEEELRKAIAGYSIHDYHKVVDNTEWDFTLEDAEKVINIYGIEQIYENIEAQFVQSIMNGHHITDDNARTNSMKPEDEEFDSFSLITFADAIASSENISQVEASTDNYNRRLQKVLKDFSCSLKTCTAKELPRGEVRMAVLGSIANTLVSDTVSLLRVYEQGVMFLVEDNETLEVDNDLLWDEINDTLRENHISYSDETQESGGLSLESRLDSSYNLSFRDVFYRGLDGAITGVIQKSVGDAHRMNDVQERIQDSVSNKIEPYFDVEIHTGTRRVEGISRGINTIRESIEPFFDVSDKEQAVKMLEIFGVDSNENIRCLWNGWDTAVENGVSPATGGWAVKLVIGQFVYDKYFIGRDSTALKQVISEIVIDNIQELLPFDKMENAFVGDAWDEVRSHTLQFIKIDGESIVDVEYTANNTCSLCDKDTVTGDAVSKERELRLFKDEELDKFDTVSEVIVNDTAVDILDDDETLCYTCQSELSIRQSATDKISQKGIYAEFGGSYGFIPYSFWMLKSLYDESRDFETGNPRVKSMVREFAENETVPSVVENVFENSVRAMRKRFFSPWSAFSIHSWFGGRSVNLTTPSSIDEAWDGIAWGMISSAYCGLSGRYSTSILEYNSNRDDMTEYTTFAFDLIEEESLCPIETDKIGLLQGRSTALEVAYSTP